MILYCGKLYNRENLVNRLPVFVNSFVYRGECIAVIFTFAALPLVKEI